MQEIVEFPEITVTLDGYFIQRKPGCDIVMASDWGTMSYPTLTQFIISIISKDIHSKKFLQKLESAVSYDTIAEHCATEIETSEEYLGVTDTAYDAVCAVNVNIHERPCGNLIKLIKNDKILRKYLGIYTEGPKSDILNDQIDNYGSRTCDVLRKLMKKQNTQGMIEDVFRKSESISEFSKKINQTDGFIHHSIKMIMKCEDYANVLLQKHLIKRMQKDMQKINTNIAKYEKRGHP